LILTAQGAGALLGGTALLRFAPQRPLLIATLVGLIPVIPTFLMAIPAPLGLIATAGLLAGVGNMVFNTLWETTLQQHIPEAARSRVSSYDWFGSLALQTLGFALIGPLATVLGESSALYLCGAVELVAVGSLLAIRDIRTLRPSPIRVAQPAGARGAAPEAHISPVRDHEEHRSG
jgi:MFS family permease